MSKSTSALMPVFAGILIGTSAAAQTPEPHSKTLDTPKDPGQETVLIGRTHTGDMIIQFELEPAKAMWMAMAARVQLEMDQSKGNWVVMTTPPTWAEHSVKTGELYHVEVKPIDPQSKTRISHADVKFEAVNSENGRRVARNMHPMWGGSGLHYAFNSGLGGDGTYEATITVDPPIFARSPKEKDRWMEPTTAKFHFKIADGKITEVTEPMQ